MNVIELVLDLISELVHIRLPHCVIDRLACHAFSKFLLLYVCVHDVDVLKLIDEAEISCVGICAANCAVIALNPGRRESKRMD